MADAKTKIVLSAETAGAVAQLQNFSNALGSLKDRVGSMSGLGATLAASLSVGGFAAMVKGAIDAADDLNDLSQRVGVGIKDLVAYKLAAEQSGTSLESVALGIKKLSTNLVENEQAFRAAGISTASNAEAMADIADLFKDLEDGPLKTAAAIKYFGRAGADLIPMLNGGGQALRDSAEKTRKLADEYERLAPKADEFNDKLKEINLYGSAFAVTISSSMIDGISDLAKQMAEAASKGDVLETSLRKLAQLDVSLLARVLKTIAPKSFGDAIDEAGSRMFSALEKEAPSNIKTGQEILDAMKADQPKVPTTEDKEKKARSDAAAARVRKSGVGADSSGAAMKDAAGDSFLRQLREKNAQLQAEADANGKLTDAQKYRIETESKLGEIIAKLTPLQQAKARALLDENAALISHKEIAAADAKQWEQVSKGRAESLRTIQDSATAAESEVENYGKTRSEIEATVLARQQERYEKQLALGVDAQYLTDLADEIEARKRLVGALASHEALDANKKAADESARAWDNITRDINQSLADAIMNGGMNGAQLLKNYFKTLVLTPVISGIMSPITGAIGSALGFNTGGGGSGALSTAANGVSLYSNLSGGGMYNAFATSSLGSSLGLSYSSLTAGTATEMAIDAGILGGADVGAISGAAGTLTGLGAALPWVGGALAIGSALGLFGGGGEDPHNNADTKFIDLALSKSGISARAAQLGQVGNVVMGQTSGSGRWADWSAFTADQQKQLTGGAAALFKSGHSLADLLGVSGAQIDSASAEGQFADINAALGSLADSIAKRVIPNIEAFQQSGESLAQTAERLGNEFKLTKTIAELMGKTVADAFGQGALSAQDSLIQSLGGSSSASSLLSDFYAKFYSNAERAAKTSSGLDTTFKSLGISVAPKTRQQFRDLVNAQDLATESGRTMYATLMAISGAFADVTASADDARKAITTDKFKTKADYQRAFYGDGSLVAITPVADQISALREETRAMVLATNETARILRRWNGDGMPTTRVIA